jgi:hypothetical protein
MLDADWRLTSGHIRGPAGDRLAEKLLESHNGSLNVPMLGLPVEVRWFPFSGQSGGGTAYGSAWLAADGTLERIRVVGMVANSRALGQKMKEQLVAQGVPEVTKLTGDKSSS